MVVGRDENARRSYCDCASFYLSCKWVMVGPNFKVVRDPGVFRANVVKQDGLTVLVPVKPLVKALVIDARIL